MTCRLLKWPGQSALAMVVAALVGVTLPAPAQSALDGFDPNANSTVRAIVVQADGKLVIGGDFTALGGTLRSHLARLNADGSIDTTFDPGANAPVRSLAVQPDGKILVGGDFTSLGGGGNGVTARQYIGRLLPSGALDPGFDPGADGSVNCLAIQTNGSILVAGWFSALAGVPRNYFGCLNNSGTLDATFSDPQVNGVVNTIAVQADGKILLGGFFSAMGATPCTCIGRLNANGSPDPTFTSPAPDGYVNSVAVTADGRVFVGGSFYTVDGQPRSFITRLNLDGTLDGSFIDPGADGPVNALVAQPDGKILLGGEFLTLNGQNHSGIGRLNADGTVEAAFDLGTGGGVYALALQPDGKIALGGAFNLINGQTRNRIARLNADGSLESTFNPALAGTGVGVGVYSLALQPDGKLLVGGNFSSLAGVGRADLGRLNPDGSLDSFSADTDGTVRCLAVQNDGGILAAGRFSMLGGQAHANLGRLNSDGSLDAGFTAAVVGGANTVYSLALQPDGKILVGGDFLILNGQTHNYLGRLDPDGSLDTAFNPILDGAVYAITLQPDGGILLGGSFHTINGQSRPVLGRLTSNGAADATFNPTVAATTGSLSVQALALQADGDILVGGSFNRVSDFACTNLARLLPNGATDTAFNPSVNGTVYTLAIQADHRIVVGGWFNLLAGQLRNRLGRLNADGSLDSAFDPSAGVDNPVYSLALQTDGKIVVGGLFNALSGQARKGLGRLTSGAAALQRLALTQDGGGLTWTRGGTSPELQQVTLERSSDGLTYTPITNGTRITGGWLFDTLGPATPGLFYLRARGRAGDGVGSSGLIESLLQAAHPIPRLTEPTLLATGAFQFTFTSFSGASFTALAATNPCLPASAWSVLGPIPEISPGQYQFTDSQAPNYSCRFYRLRSP